MATVTSEKISEVVELYTNSSLLVREIAVKCSVSPNQVTRIVKRKGIILRGRKEFLPIEFSSEDIQRMVTLYNENLSFKAIGEQFSISRATIERVMRSQNVKRRRGNAFQSVKMGIDEQEVIAHYLRCGYVEKTARHFKMGRGAVFGLLARNNVKVRGNTLTHVDDAKADIISLYEKGHSFQYIGTKYDITPQSIKDRLVVWGIPIVKRTSKLVDETGATEAEVAQKYLELKSITDTADYYGVSPPTINAALKRQGIKSPRENFSSLVEQNKEHIVIRYNAGDSSIKISKDIGVHKRIILQILREAGLAPSYKIRDQNKAILEVNKERIHDLYNVQFLSVEEIATILKISTNPIRSIMKKWGWESRDSRYEESSLERRFKRILDKLGIRFEQHLKVEKRVYDFYLPDFNLLVECNGDYWHGHPRVFPEPRAEQIKGQKRDVAKNKLARKTGYEIYFIWESEINKAPDLVTTLLRKLIAGEAPINQSSPMDFLTERPEIVGNSSSLLTLPLSL
jgi:G:T-mismatch repair DNA endonuclease (very short patch repair protein)/DNA-binding CsgD family transcriptional regulator